jgi:hypothetical protein
LQQAQPPVGPPPHLFFGENVPGSRQKKVRREKKSAKLFLKIKTKTVVAKMFSLLHRMNRKI